MRAFCARLEAGITAIGAALVATFTLVILADVACRYLLKIPLAWAAEFTVFLFQLTCFVGATVALRRGMHFGLGPLVHDLWPRAAHALKPIVALLVVAMTLLVTGLAVRMADQAWNAMYATLPISQATIYLVMTASGLVMAVFGLEPLVTGKHVEVGGE